MDERKLCEILKEKSKKDVEINIKDYKSTFIRVLISSRKIKLSLNSLFLKASDDIENAIALFCLKKDKEAFRKIKNYANANFLRSDRSSMLDLTKLDSSGRVYDLKNILDNINKINFENKLDLNITYFAKPNYKRFSHFTFGSFDISLKLIKINKILDSELVPFYFVNYIVHHEILHYVYPMKISEGRRSVHTKEFKQNEKKIAYFKEAIDFEKKFIKDIGLKRRVVYGRS